MAALLIDRRDAEAHSAIGQLYLDSGRDAEAVAAFNRALELMPGYYETRYALATAHTRLGHTAEAARQLDLFERARREALEQSRRDFASEVERKTPSDAALASATHRAEQRTVDRRPSLRCRQCRPRSAMAVVTARDRLRRGHLPCLSSSTSRARRASRFTIPTAQAPRNISSRPWGRAAVFFDYDGDGWVDIFLVDGGSIARSGCRPARASSAVPQPRQRHVRRRHAIARASSIAGAAWARARATTTATAGRTCTSPTTDRTRSTAISGDGTFTDVTAAAHVGDPRWSTGCAFADLDRDGDLDLWVVNYVDADRAHSPFCGERPPRRAVLLPSAELRPAAEHRLPQRRRRRLHGRERLVRRRRAARQWPRRRHRRLRQRRMAGRVRRERRDAELSVPQRAAACGSRKPGSSPASPSAPTARRAPAWASMRATTTATAGWIW